MSSEIEEPKGNESGAQPNFSQKKEVDYAVVSQVMHAEGNARVEELQEKDTSLTLRDAFSRLRYSGQSYESVFAELNRNPSGVAAALRELHDTNRLYEFPAEQGTDIYREQAEKVNTIMELANLLQGGVGISRLTGEGALPADQRSALQAGQAFFGHMLQHPDTEVRMGMLNFLIYNLREDQMNLKRAKSPTKASISESRVQVRERVFNRKKEMTMPLLKTAAVEAAQRNETTELKTLFRGLRSLHADEEAQAVLLDTAITTPEQRQAAVVGYMNAYGFINGVDMIAHAATNNDLDDQVRHQLETVYARVEGQKEKLDTIMPELEDVYESIDFSKYELNSPELTAEECQRIERLAADYASEHKVLLQDVEVLDIGAGTGRHARPLHQKGYRITALEPLAKHIEYMKGEDPDLPIVQADTDTMEEKLPEAYQANIVYGLGRFETHLLENSTTLRFYDEMRLVTSDDATVLIDEPDISGLYAQQIQELNDSLTALGIEPSPHQLLFDGPDTTHKFNRRVHTGEEREAINRLLGWRTVNVEEKLIGEGNIRNTYLTFEKDPDFDPRAITREELQKHAAVLGLFSPSAGVEEDTFIKSWGMTIGQAMAYGLEDDRVRKLNAEGNPPSILTDLLPNGTVYFEGKMSVAA